MVKSKNDVAFNIVVYAIMIIVLLVCLIPILYVISMSFTPYAELVKRGGFVLIPSKFTLTAYHEMLKDGSLLNGLWVTVRLTVIGTICNLFFTLLMAYPLSLSITALLILGALLFYHPSRSCIQKTES